MTSRLLRSFCWCSQSHSKTKLLSLATWTRLSRTSGCARHSAEPDRLASQQCAPGQLMWSGARRTMLGPPSGLRAGSPPFPPPRLIRPIVRLLPRSPRLSGPGPHQRPCRCAARQTAHGSGRSCFHLSELLKFGQNVTVMLREVAHHPRIAEQLADDSHWSERDRDDRCRRTSRRS